MNNETISALGASRSEITELVMDQLRTNEKIKYLRHWYPPIYSEEELRTLKFEISFIYKGQAIHLDGKIR